MHITTQYTASKSALQTQFLTGSWIHRSNWNIRTKSFTPKIKLGFFGKKGRTNPSRLRIRDRLRIRWNGADYGPIAWRMPEEFSSGGAHGLRRRWSRCTWRSQTQLRSDLPTDSARNHQRWNLLVYHPPLFIYFTPIWWICSYITIII